MNKIKKEAKRPNSIRGTQRFTKPSQTNGNANVQINTETTIPKLEKLAQEYIGITNPYGFLTNLRTALGISNSKGASKYGVVKIPKEDGSVLEASLRITNHNSNAETYISHNANYEYNLSILVRKNFQSNRFKPHDNVKLDEFVYYGKKISKVENPLTQIINSIIGFLQNGVYEDTTGIAFKNTSPTNENKEYKTIKNMKRQVIRLTEGDLHRIIKESVNNILYEYFDYRDFEESEPSLNSNHPYWIDSEGNVRASRLGVDDIDGVYNTKKSQINHDWHDIDKKRRIEQMMTKDAMELHPNFQKNMNSFNQNTKSAAKEYIQSGGDAMKDEWDEQWNKQMEFNKINNQANSRPLHRKGSLNREL